MALVTATVRNAVDERRAMRTQHQLRQSELLLAAGIQRATQQLQATTDYTGETWELAAETLSGVESAQVEIDITPEAYAEAEKSSRKVRVTARLSTGPHTAIQRSYSFSVDLKTFGKESPDDD